MCHAVGDHAQAADRGAELDPAFVESAAIPSDPLSLDTDEIDIHREEWIDRWTTIVTG